MTKELNFFQSEIEVIEASFAEKASPPLPASIELTVSAEEKKPPLSELEAKNLATILTEKEASEGHADQEIETEEEAQIDQHIQQHIKKVMEALLFTCPDPLPLAKMREITDTIFPLRPRQLRQLLDSLKQEYIAQQRSFKLEEIAQGYVLRTHEEYAPYLELLHRQRRGEKLSHAATEVLAIIAYRQPITRPQIDAIRGVDSSGTLMQLLERQLVEPVGKLEAPGRPTLYGTTKEFLKHFGLKDLHELKGKL